MNKARKLLITLGLVATVGAGLVACGHHNNDPASRADYVVSKLDRRLDLDENQHQQLLHLKDVVLEAIGDVDARRAEKQRNLDELLSQPTLDQARVLALVEQHTAEVNSKAPQIVTALAGFYDSLNPEQQTELKEKALEYHQDHHGWHH